jgi:catechol 2,3-dioxygenase-like lactoylglutathione lyase family enzyme
MLAPRSGQELRCSLKGAFNMRTVVVFVMGLVLGSVVATSMAQSNRLAGMDGVNHVGLYVQDVDKAAAFYTQKMGFKEAFTVHDDKGQIFLKYIQVNKNTFIELQPVTKGRTAGISHMGLQVANIRETVDTLKKRGVTVEEPRTGSTKSLIAKITATDGVRIELSELPPESLQSKAIASWK